MTSPVKVKAGYNTITRRFDINCDCSWAELKLQIGSLFDLQDEFTLKYIDDEDELVTLGTHGELEEALKVTQETGLLRLFVESTSDQRPTVEIESFKDLLGETTREIPAAPKRKFLFNSTAQSEPSSAYKTAKMDDSEISEAAATLAQSSQQASTNAACSYDFGSSSIQSQIQGTENSKIDANESIDDADGTPKQNPSSSGQPPISTRQGDMPVSQEQYIPLVQLMVPPPSSAPPRPPPPSAKPRKVPKGRKGRGCYIQLAENVAVELTSMNERLHQKLRSSFEVLQAKETNDIQGLGELEEESFVFVNQQGNLMAPNEDMNFENEILSSSSSCDQTRETEEESLDDTPNSPENSLASDGNGSDLHNVNHTSIEQAVNRVVQESLPRIVEQTLKNLQGLHLDDQLASSSPVQAGAKVVHKGIFCAECSQAVTGVRYKCCFCTDYDLCEDCEGKDGIHDPNHFFAKLRNHVPGIGRKNGEMVPVLKPFVCQRVLKEESKNEKKEEKKREKEERMEEKRRVKDEKKERKKEKMLSKAARQEEKDKRELKRKLRQIRHERESATATERLQNCLNAEFIADASIPDETVLKGEQKFLKRWIVKNKGRKWNARTVLQCVEGNIIVGSGENTVEVPFLKPDEQGELAVPFITPPAPGHYESKWQLCHHSIPFGPLFWCQIVVEGDKVECEVTVKENSTEPAQYPSHDNITLVNSAFPEQDTTPVRKLVEHIVPQGVVTEEADDASGSDAYLSSEDTADFEKIRMPLESVLMASQAAQAAELEWDAAGCTLDAESCDKAQIEELVMGTTEDAGSDAESILSDISDEFMVVPVPPCFNPEAPLTSDPSHVTVSMTEYKQLSESHQGPFSLNLTSLESVKSGPASASYTGTSVETTLEDSSNIAQRSATSTETALEVGSNIAERCVTSIETALEVGSNIAERCVTSIETTLEVGSNIAERSATSTETTLVVGSNIDERSATSIETTLEMTSRITMEEENGVFDLANETLPQLPEPLIPEPGLDAPVTMEELPTDLDPNEPNLPITHEPLPATEPPQDDNSDDDDDDDDDGGNDDARAQSEVNSQPIATQPLSGTDEPPPVALQPEPSTPVNVVPTTVRTRGVVQHIPNSSSDFPSSVVSDVLSTAIDAVASAGRAVITTVDNFLAGSPKSQTTATYNPEQGCEISVSPPAESDVRVPDSPEVHPVIWPPGRSPATCLDCLMEMGFCDRKLNEQLLKKHNNNVAQVVNELLSFTDNEWSTRRH